MSRSSRPHTTPTIPTQPIALNRLSREHLVSLCHTYKATDRISSSFDCDGKDLDRRTLLNILREPVTYANAIAKVNADSILYQPPYLQPYTPRGSVTTPLPLNSDLISIIGQYADYGTLLAMVAAYPTPTLTQALYSPSSPLWDRRLQSLTGRGCLRDPYRPNRPASSPWSCKAQHDAALPRAGYLVTEAIGNGGNDRIMVCTNRRIKGMIEYVSTQVEVVDEVNGTEIAYSVDKHHIIAIWEDGSVRRLWASIMALDNGDTDVERLKTIIEGDEDWDLVRVAPYIPVVYEVDRRGTAATTPFLPPMRMLASLSGPVYGPAILCLDNEGVLWYGTVNTEFDHDPDPILLARITPPSQIPGEPYTRVAHFTVVQSKVGSTDANGPPIVILSYEDGSEQLLHIRHNATVQVGYSQRRVECHLPIYYPSRTAATKAVSVYPNPILLSSDTIVVDTNGEPMMDQSAFYFVIGVPSAASYFPYPYRVDDVRSAYCQLLASGKPVVASVEHGAITDPSLHHHQGTSYDIDPDIAAIQSYMNEHDDYQVAVAQFYRITIYPHWNLGAPPVHSKNMSKEDKLLSRHYTYIQAAMTAWGSKLSILTPEGGVVSVVKYPGPDATTVDDGLYVRTVDLAEKSGGEVEAMVRMANVTWSGETATGIGV